MVDAMPGCVWGWLRPSRTAASRAAQAGGLGKREAGEPAPCLSHQPGVHRCGINHLGGFGLGAVVERVLEVLAELFAGRVHLIARPARLEADHAHELVAEAVAPGVALRFGE